MRYAQRKRRLRLRGSSLSDEPSLLVDLVVALGVAAAGGWIATRLGLSSIVGYIAGGVVISPFTPGFVPDVDRLRLIAEIGVVLLMFGVGVHFSLGDLRATRPMLVLAGTLQVAAVMTIGTLIGLAAGWGEDEALFAGAAIAISSSTVIVKLLGDGGALATEYGRAAVAWSIVEDICAVVIVSLLIGLSGEGDVASSLGVTSVKALAFVLVALVVGLRLAPWLLERAARVASGELFVLVVAALALGMALGSEKVGLSVAFGAFLGGMIVSESPVSHRVLEDMLPARDVFGALFFVSVGMLIDPDVLGDNLGALAALLGAIVLGKGAVSLGLARAIGYAPAVALPLAALVAQAGEFSFVLAGIGVDRGVVSADVFSLVVAATAISMALTPVLMLAVRRADRRSGRPASRG